MPSCLSIRLFLQAAQGACLLSHLKDLIILESTKIDARDLDVLVAQHPWNRVDVNASLEHCMCACMTACMWTDTNAFDSLATLLQHEFHGSNSHHLPTIRQEVIVFWVYALAVEVAASHPVVPEHCLLQVRRYADDSWFLVLAVYNLNVFVMYMLWLKVTWFQAPDSSFQPERDYA